MQGAQDAVEVTLALDIGGTFIKSAVFSGGKLVRKLPQIPSKQGGAQIRNTPGLIVFLAEAIVCHTLRDALCARGDWFAGELEELREVEQADNLF